MLSEKLLAVLSEMGLNKYESKIYLTLILEGTSTAKNISDITSIPYGKVYEIIDSLAAKGMVMTLPTKPMKCQAVHPKESITLLKKNYKEKIENFEEVVSREIVPIFMQNRQFTDPEGTFLVLKGRSNANKKIEAIIGSAKEHLYISMSKNGLKRLGFHKELLDEANSRGVKIMVAGEIDRDNYEDIKSLDGCDFRHLNGIPSHFFSVDGSECMMVEPLPDDDNFAYGRDLSLLFSKPCFTKFLEGYFEIVFSRSKPLDQRLKELKLEPPKECLLRKTKC